MHSNFVSEEANHFDSFPKKEQTIYMYSSQMATENDGSVETVGHERPVIQALLRNEDASLDRLIRRIC